MDTLTSLLFSHGSVPGSIFVLLTVCAFGSILGRVRLLGIELGLTGVLFAGLLGGYLDFSIDPSIVQFGREFGLILFLYMVGLQVGRGIDAIFSVQGIVLNIAAAVIVGLGALLTTIAGALFSFSVPVSLGIFAGASSNTPALGAVEQAAHILGHSSDLTEAAAAAYALTYPFGLFGTIISILTLRLILRVDLRHEDGSLEAAERRAHPEIVRASIELTSPDFVGQRIRDISALARSKIIISRVLRDGRIIIAGGSLILQRGDLLQIVGSHESVKYAERLLGPLSPLDVSSVPGVLTSRDVAVTRREAVGKSLSELDIRTGLNVNVTRIRRGEIEILASSAVSLQFGDQLRVVGTSEDLDQLEKMVGNRVRSLLEPELLPVFLGMVIGMMLGSVAFALPGLPVPFKIGLAGGPLLVAILASRLGQLGPFVSFLPASSNLALKEIGIILFLACVGIPSGKAFFTLLLTGSGISIMLVGAVVTALPLIIVGSLLRVALKINFLTIAGVLSGATTNPASLAYLSNQGRSSGTAVAYATVYPLTMMLRVLIAQLLLVYRG